MFSHHHFTSYSEILSFTISNFFLHFLLCLNVASSASKPTVIFPPEAVKGVEADVKDLTLKDLSYKDNVYNIELNWLMFNWRVLAMSEDVHPSFPFSHITLLL